MKNSITQTELKAVLDYAPDTGLFTWKLGRASSRSKIGDVAGTPVRGYTVITIERHRYQAHRLAWLFVNGGWPKHDIDHINGSKSDNRICNLRDVSHSINMHNLSTANRENKSSGLLGVRRVNSKKNPWQAGIKVDGTYRHIGVFPSPEEAHSAYLCKKTQLQEGTVL